MTKKVLISLLVSLEKDVFLQFFQRCQVSFVIFVLLALQLSWILASKRTRKKKELVQALLIENLCYWKHSEAGSQICSSAHPLNIVRSLFLRCVSLCLLYTNAISTFSHCK